MGEVRCAVIFILSISVPQVVKRLGHPLNKGCTHQWLLRQAIDADCPPAGRWALRLSGMGSTSKGVAESAVGPPELRGGGVLSMPCRRVLAALAAFIRRMGCQEVRLSLPR